MLNTSIPSPHLLNSSVGARLVRLALAHELFEEVLLHHHRHLLRHAVRLHVRPLAHLRALPHVAPHQVHLALRVLLRYVPHDGVRLCGLHVRGG
ncbi:unnamed protein product [Closterium sp. NIES-53]